MNKDLVIFRKLSLDSKTDSNGWLSTKLSNTLPKGSRNDKKNQ
jgi:hypothetical protein